MFIDAQLLFSDAQAITADAASTNLIDIGIAKNLFDGEPLAVVLVVDTAADGTTTDETYEFQIEMDDAAAFSTPTDLVVHSIGYASLTAGSTHIIPIPVGVNVEQYVRLYYNVGGTTPSITVTAFLQPLTMVQKYKSYSDNITIS
jgi:hypothetical protein